MALNYEDKLGEKNKEHQILSNCRAINYPSRKSDWKKLEKNHSTNPIHRLNSKKWIYMLPAFQHESWK